MDVGEAVVHYCEHARPRGHCRGLFLQLRAPYGELTPSAISAIVWSACRRSGVPRVGPHRLRHSAASAMRRAGAPLSEIGGILRHRDVMTTTIYAKDDSEALATVARRWPGGVA